MKENNSDVLATGPWGTVEFRRNPMGNCAAETYMTSVSVQDLAILKRRFERIVQTGQIFNKQQFRSLGEEIWEFKATQARVLCFRDGRRWLLTNGYPKQGQKCPRHVIDVAVAARKSYLESTSKKQ